NNKPPSGATVAFLNYRSASGRSAFVAFFHSAHSTFSLRANAEADRADHHTDTRRRRPFLNNPAPLRGRLLDDVVVRKGWRNNESRKSGIGQSCTHGSRSPDQDSSRLLSTRLKLLRVQCEAAPWSRIQARLASACLLSAGEARTIGLRAGHFGSK